MSPDSPQPPPYVSYAEFGEQFFEHAVTGERILEAVNILAGEPIEFGPTGVGPGRLVKLTARGEIGPATGTPVVGAEVAHRVVLPVSIGFEVDLGVEVHRFRASLSVPLVLTARAVEGLQVFLDITPPRSSEIAIDLQAHGLRASVLQRVAGVETEVRRFVAKYVAREIEKPYVRKARTIDVAAAIDMAWQKLVPGGRPSATASHIHDDLELAIEEELEESAHPGERR